MIKIERVPFKFNNISIKNIEDTELLKDFNIACIEQGVSRRDVILNNIRKFVNKHKKRREKKYE